MSTNLTGLDGIQKYLHSFALDESSLSIGRVNEEFYDIVKHKQPGNEF